MSELRGELPIGPQNPEKKPVSFPPKVESLPQPKIDTLSKQTKDQPSNLIATEGEGLVETDRIVEGGQEQQTLPPGHKLPKNKDVPGKANPWNTIINRLKYPSSTDGDIVQEKITVPAFLTMVASSLPLIFFQTETFGSLAAANPALALNVMLGWFGVFIPSSAVVLGSFSLRDRMREKEVKNRIPFSQLLTVSKVFTTKQSLIAPAVTRVDPSFEAGFTGELHFVGSSRASWEGLTTPLATLRDGAKGLFNLATACEQQDPRLEGISIFYGISPMLNQQFGRFGFRIFGREDLGKKSLTTKFTEGMQMVREPAFTTYPNGVKIANGKFAAGVISREELIKHKNTYEKFAGNNQ